METMKAAVLTAYSQPLTIEEVPKPSPGLGEVRLKILAAGLCSTDNHIRAGKIPMVVPPRIPGHEIAGEIDAFGPGVNDVLLGDGYIASIDVVCGECFYCTSGHPNLCLNRVRFGFERDGGFAQYVIVPVKNLVPCPKSIPLLQAAVLPDAGACMYHTLVDKANVSPGQKIIFVGLGGLAYQGIQIANHFGASVIATSRKQNKRDLGLQLGLQGACDTSQTEIMACAAGLWGEDTADVVIDNVGTQQTIELSLNLVRRGGKVIVVGYETHNVSIDIFDLMLNEKEMIGARGSTKTNLLEVVKLVESGALTPVVTNIYDFEDINTALDDLERGSVVGRAVIKI